MSIVMVSTTAFGKLEVDLGGGAELAVGEDDGAQVVEVLEAGDGGLHRHVEGGVEDLAVFDHEPSRAEQPSPCPRDSKAQHRA